VLLGAACRAEHSRTDDPSITVRAELVEVLATMVKGLRQARPERAVLRSRVVEGSMTRSGEVLAALARRSRGAVR